MLQCQQDQQLAEPGPIAHDRAGPGWDKVCLTCLGLTVDFPNTRRCACKPRNPKVGKDIVCPQCTRRFRTDYALGRHSAAMHPGE